MYCLIICLNGKSVPGPVWSVDAIIPSEPSCHLYHRFPPSVLSHRCCRVIIPFHLFWCLST